jgi:hypothetical protein
MPDMLLVLCFVVVLFVVVTVALVSCAYFLMRCTVELINLRIAFVATARGYFEQQKKSQDF